MNKKILQNTAVALASSTIIIGSLLTAGIASAQTPQSDSQGGRGWGLGAAIHADVDVNAGMHARMPGVFGTVSTINGTTLTVTSKRFGAPNTTSSSTQTYTVDASNATVFKGGATSTLSSVAVGDTVVVAGTVSGTNVTATTIRDGTVPNMMGGKPGERGDGKHASSTPLIQGNGQPVIGGTVSAVSGNMVTVVTATGNVTYSVDVTNATIKKGNATSSVSNIAVGDKVIVQGTVSGTSVTASSVIDSAAASTNGGSAGASHSNGGIGKIFNSIGSFFHNFFGFF